MQSGVNVCANCANQPGIACSPKGEEKWSKVPEEKWHAFPRLLAVVLLGSWQWCCSVMLQVEIKDLEYLRL